MATLGTTYDSNFYHRQAQQGGQALGAFVDLFHQRRAEKEQKEQEDIAAAFKAIQAMPELADTYGADLERKYGHKYPEVSQILAVVRQRRQLAQELPAAQNDYYSALDAMEKGYAAQQERLARMPDTVAAPAPFNPFAIQGIVGPPAPQIPLRAAANPTVQLPNPDKAATQRALSEVRPELFPVDALGKLSPKRRDLARVALKAQGIDLPDQTPFDTFKDLSQRAKGVEAVRRGYIPAESATAKVIGYEGGLELSPEDLAKQQHETGEREAREKARAAATEESDRLQRERFKLEDDLRAKQLERRTTAQKELISFRAEVKGTSGTGADWKALVKDSTAVMRDYDVRHRDALAGLSGKARADAHAAFVEQNGDRPRAVSEVAARRIMREIRTVGLEGPEADDAAVKMSSQYIQQRQQGASESAAIKRSVGEWAPSELIPEPGAAVAPSQPKKLFPEIKDAKRRGWAVDEYMRRIEAGEAPDAAKTAIQDQLRGKTKPSGNRAVDNNNPLNIKAGPATKKWLDSGAAVLDPRPAQDGGKFLRFPSPDAGLKAAEDLLFNSGVYSNLTIDQAMKKWSNGGYGGEIIGAGDTPLADLPPEARRALLQAMAQRESGSSSPMPATATAEAAPADAESEKVRVWARQEYEARVARGEDPKDATAAVLQILERRSGRGSR